MKTIMMENKRDWQDIYSYHKQALDLLDTNHPHYEEIKDLLLSQVNDELQDLEPDYNYGNRGTS